MGEPVIRKEKNMKDLYVGIDLGGTFIKCGIVTKEGEVLIKGQTPTEVEKGLDGVLANIVGIMRKQLGEIGRNEEDVVAMGFGVPGIVDEDFTVIEATNLGWHSENVVERMKTLTSVPVKLGNDADVAALGEVKFGVAKGMKSAFMITLGTGVGSGIIINGKIFSGNHGCGGEIGHTVLHKDGEQCNCGQKGCVEAYLSATALKKFAQRAMNDNPDTKLWERAKSVDEVTAKDVLDLSEEDEMCRKLTCDYIENLFDLCLNLANGFRPEAIILGGGVSLAGEKLTKPLQAKLDDKIFAKAHTPKVKILSAKLGNDAGFVGAASLCIE